MSRKSDLIAALQCKQPEKAVPIWELHFHLWEEFSEHQFISGEKFRKLSNKEKEKALEMDAEIMLSVAEKMNFGGVSIPDPPWDCFYTLPQEDRLKLVQLLKQKDPDFLIIASAGAVLSMPGSDNFQEFCYKLFDNPQEIDQMCKDKYKQGIEQAKQLRDAGVEAIYTASDMADNHGPFFNSEQMDRFILPYLEKWSEKLKEMNIFSILHTDGNIDPVLNDLVDTKIDALQAIDPISGMNIKKVKDKVGNRVCICGNVDCGLLLTGTPQEIYNEVIDKIQYCKKNGGYVLGASNAVIRETPVANYKAVLKAWSDYGKYDN